VKTSPGAVSAVCPTLLEPYPNLGYIHFAGVTENFLAIL
jgi:hypothetical protein